MATCFISVYTRTINDEGSILDKGVCNYHTLVNIYSVTSVSVVDDMKIRRHTDSVVNLCILFN